MSLTLRILVALVLGLAAGAALATADAPILPTVLDIAKTVGGLWLDALRMTIVPLIFSLLITGVATATAGTAAAGGLAARTLGLFAVLLLTASVATALVLPGLLNGFPPPADAAKALRAALGEAAPTPAAPPLGEWLRSFIPTNPVAAAADGAMVSLVIFGLVFGLALTRIAPVPRRRLTEVFEAVVQAMLVLVRWVLWAAPAGVFALSLGVGAQAGLGAAGALAHYVVVISLVCGVSALAMYPLAVLAGRVTLGDFVRAAAPAQLVAFSTQSSIASMPAMIQAVRARLQVSEAVSGVVLPLAVSLFRITSATANIAVAVYVGVLFGVEFTVPQLLTGAAVAAVVSLAAVGLPSQVSFFAVVGPICLAMGVPIEILPLLLAVESIPDIFRTVGNVTGDIAVATVASRVQGERA